jgi:hypothetical protein
MVKTGFTLKERIVNSSIGLFTCKSTKSYVDQINTPKQGTNLNEINETRNKCFKVTVLETSQLEMDPDVIHPFVRIHVVDFMSG